MRYLSGCVFLTGGLIGSSFFQVSKSNFCRQLELNNNYLYSFGHKEKIDLFVCSFVCFAQNASEPVFFLVRLPNWCLLCVDSDKRILPLCYKHVFAMSSRKIRGKSQ